MARQTGKGQSTSAELTRRGPPRLPEETRERLAGTTVTLGRMYKRGETQHDQGEMQLDIDRILARLDVEIPEAMKEMDALLARLRTTRIVEAA